MPSQPRSNVRAYVRWRNSSVFAGEELECIITFRNIGSTADTAPSSALQSPSSITSRYAPSTAQTTAPSTVHTRPAHTRSTSIASTQHEVQGRGHRPTLSLNLARVPSKGGHGAARGTTPVSAPVGRGHGRSLSILSMGSEYVAERRSPTTIAAMRKPSRGGHNRSASLQVSRSPLQSAHSMTHLPPRRHSPLYEASTLPAFAENKDEPLPVRPIRRKPGVTSAGNTPQLKQSGFPGTITPEEMPTFEFPPRQTSLSNPAGPEKPKPVRNPATMHSSQRPHAIRSNDSFSSTSSAMLNPMTRVLSESSRSGTPRSSMDFYSLSNNSDETLTSEPPSLAPGISNGMISKSVKPSRKDILLGPARPETLLIGYARTTGSFTLDASLVNNAPFDEVKRKTVQSDGGVVGVEKPKRSSGMFGALGWGLGESIGSLLGGGELSTIAQMKASTGSKAIPLLSTPQSLLFVDITLAPGESKSFVYRFPLPKGLPPSHKGRAIKVEYNLAIGIQRPGGQSVKYVNAPFRVLGSVSSRGEPLGHDLMIPYVLLQDAGKSQSIDLPALSISSVFPTIDFPVQKRDPQQGLESFLRYTERLLETPADDNGALLSPTESLSPVRSRKSSILDAPANTKEAIDLALLNANLIMQNGGDSLSDAQSANRFTIARSGQHVAVLTLLRPAFRIGESLTGTIDLTVRPTAHDATTIPAYSIHIELQSTEEVDALLALRSEASIERVTKRIHASTRENSLFARKIGFNLPIPVTSTPSFETSGVSHVWTLRIDFTTFKPLRGPGAPETDQGGDQLLEELSRDGRGISLIAKERLPAETFEIAVPIRIYGASAITDVEREPEALEV